MKERNTEMTSEEIRRMLLFRSWHRGTKEMDILIGRFAETVLGGFKDHELKLYASFLEMNDPDLYDFYCNRLSLDELYNKEDTYNILNNITSADKDILSGILARFKTFTPA